MRSINDWYDNSAHRGDLDPRYDPENDEVRDRPEFGEAPQREWIPRGASGVRGSDSARRRSTVRKKAATSSTDWRGAVRTWLKLLPAGSYIKCRDAVRRAGYPGVTRKMVAEVARQMQASEYGKKPKKATQRHRPRPQSRLSAPEPAPVRRDVCDGCGLVVSELGYCGCG